MFGDVCIVNWTLRVLHVCDVKPSHKMSYDRFASIPTKLRRLNDAESHFVRAFRRYTNDDIDYDFCHSAFKRFNNWAFYLDEF